MRLKNLISYFAFLLLFSSCLGKNEITVSLKDSNTESPSGTPSAPAAPAGSPATLLGLRRVSFTNVGSISLAGGVTFAGNYYLSALDDTGANKLFRYDGTSFTAISNTSNGGNDNVSKLTVSGSNLYFLASNSLN